MSSHKMAFEAVISQATAPLLDPTFSFNAFLTFSPSLIHYFILFMA